MQTSTRNLILISLFAFVVGALLASAAHGYLYLKVHASFTQMNYHEKLNVYSNMKHHAESGNSAYVIEFFDLALETSCDAYSKQSTGIFWDHEQALFEIQQVRKVSGNCL